MTPHLFKTPNLAETVVFTATPSLPRRMIIGAVVSAALCVVYLLGCYLTGYVNPMPQSYVLWTFGLGIPMDLAVELFMLYKTKPNIATITTHRVIAPGGRSMALADIGGVKRSLDTLIITSRDTKRELRITSLPNPAPFRRALADQMK